MDSLSRDDLNALYSAALAFGADWRRPLAELADERLPDASREERAALAAAVDECRSTIEKHIAMVHSANQGRWPRSDVRDVGAWIRERYPWMSPRNRRRAISQGQYYAWHG